MKLPPIGYAILAYLAVEVQAIGIFAISPMHPHTPDALGYWICALIAGNLVAMVAYQESQKRR